MIKSTASILEALKIIDAQGLQIGLVVDDELTLMGVVTDGDIRRGILGNTSLEAPVSNIMKTSPIVAEVDTPKEDLIRTMEKSRIFAIPLIKNGRVVGLETLHQLFERKKYNNPVFIMAGGFGTRLKPMTDSCPKPMLNVGGKPILETILRRFIEAGFSNFYISTHYMPEQIENYFGNGSTFGVNISYIHEDSPLGTGGSLGLLPKDLPQGLPLIMMNGDVLTKVDFTRLLKFHEQHQAGATMCVREYDYQIPYGVIEGEGHLITSMVEKPVQRFFVNAGIYIVSPEIISSVPKNFRIDMPELLEQHMDKGKEVLMFPIHEYWLDIGRLDDFNRAQMDIHSLGVLN